MKAFERGIGSVADAIGFLWDMLSAETEHDLEVERRDTDRAPDDDEWDEETDPGFIDTEGEDV